MYCERCGTKVVDKVYYCPSCDFKLKDTRSRFWRYMFICHQRPERSFFIRDRQMPVCARCTGIVVGYIIGILLCFFIKNESFIFPILLAVPTGIDGFGQLYEKWVSNNFRRCFTGIFAGVGLILLFQATFLLGGRVARMF
ncbi:MAG: DUF2085 domain-containing protein [Sarcina sp.]